MLQEVLTAVLKPEHREAGLYLDEDPCTLYLMKDGKVLDFWNATKATVEEVWEAADTYLVEICPKCGTHRANTIEMLGEDCGHQGG